jgi:hypothetical protein
MEYILMLELMYDIWCEDMWACRRVISIAFMVRTRVSYFGSPDLNLCPEAKYAH